MIYVVTGDNNLCLYSVKNTQCYKTVVVLVAELGVKVWQWLSVAGLSQSVNLTIDFVSDPVTRAGYQDNPVTATAATAAAAAG